jgi:hypothetical protein
MSAKENGGPAFPVECTDCDGEMRGKKTGTYTGWHVGMTTRDFFAAHAVSGVLHMVATGQHELGVVRPTGAAGIARSAYEIADAMIRARGAA